MLYIDQISRLELLFALLRYSSLKGNYFTSGERICINQERGQILANQSAIERNEPIIYPPFQYSKSLENKIKFVKSKISNDQKINVNELID